ncbi:MAG: cupin domain-containing protein [Nocardioides sp.]|nr:cupin domain-containing protein [Nocardioides sp.]
MPVVRAAELTFTELPRRRSADPAPIGMGAAYSTRIVRVPPGPRTPHLHPHSDEVTYVASGSGTAWEGDVATRVGPGDLIFVPRGIAHATVADDAGDLELVCFFPHGDLPSNTVELDAPLRSACPSDPRGS